MGSYRGLSGGRTGPTVGRTVAWLGMVTALAVFGLLMSGTGAAGPVQSAAQRVGEPVTGALHAATAPLADFAANVGSYGRLRTENRELRAENERLQVELVRLREEEIRTAELADLAGLGDQLRGGRLVYAAIVQRDPNPLRDAVAINRGTRDGVQKGMPVLGKGGALVGTVETAHASVSWVRLITDAESAVNAIIQESRAYALAAGSAGRTLRLEFLAQGMTVKPGDNVVTSGLGRTYPAGRLIGRVAKVEGGPEETFRQVQVEPAVRLSSLESVAVLTSFLPAPIEGLGR